MPGMKQRHSMLTHFRAPSTDEIESLDLFDDRTLHGLIGTALRPLSDGVDNDNPYNALPVERWARMAGWKVRA